jgi:type II secretory ATPase GspE/PulE/Tfp pilus assembly ATPase PilB-like protein
MKFFNQKAKVDNLISIADIPAISLISKIKDIELKNIVESKMTKAYINYIIFAGIFKDTKMNVLYVLVNDEIKPDELNNLAKKLLLLKKNFIYQEICKTSQSSLKDAKTSYNVKSIMSESQCAIYFNQILVKAISLNTSDIHISARPSEAVVKIRVNGDLIELDHYTYDDMLKIISSAYNKFASRDSKHEHFDVKETHETAIRKNINGETYNLRFISKPITPAGSFNVTIRIIDESFSIPLDKLGYTDKQLSILQKVTNNPHGLVVLAGQVGSGKSVTIQSEANYYIKLATIKGNLTKKLITFESPVEYPIVGADQIEYKRNPKHSAEQERLHLEANIQSLLRMDSDACVLQEIRSKNTAQLAIDLVQSNNLVFTTVHAQSVLQIFSRFKGLGMSIDILTEPSFLLALVYQTLIKTPCSYCAMTISADHQELKECLISLIS